MPKTWEGSLTVYGRGSRVDGEMILITENIAGGIALV